MFITGEHWRTIDDRFRLMLPADLAESVTDESGDVILAKERAGCVSLWRPAAWQQRLDSGIALLKQKIDAGRMEQPLGRCSAAGSSVVDSTSGCASGKSFTVADSREFSGVSGLCVGSGAGRGGCGDLC